jgi:ribonuclease BN (tRNA processing enzyme)
MKLTVLGNWGGFPEALGATAGYLLQAGERFYLLDCGSGVLAQLLARRPLPGLDGVLLTHFHHDHCADLGCLQYAWKLARNFHRTELVLPIYAADVSPRFADLDYEGHTRGVPARPGASVLLAGGLRVSFHHTVHAEYNLALRLEYEGRTLVYTGDAGPETEWGDFCRGADVLLCETSLFEKEAGLFPGHLTTRQAAELALAAGAGRLLLTHFPHLGDLGAMEAEASRYFPRAERTTLGGVYEVCGDHKTEERKCCSAERKLL